MASKGQSPAPLRVAVVGAGPAGFFSADALLKAVRPVHVTLIEQLPAPYGLVRYGVAPDHPEIKRVTRQFDRIAGHPHLDFWGNVGVGRDVAVAELRQAFDAVILACGTPDSSPLGIPGEDVAGSISAARFVGWYNGVPDLGAFFQPVGRGGDAAAADATLETDTAVVIGNGNVALDCARILAKTETELRATDIAAEALATLARHRLQTIYVVGRRGPVQAAWTSGELKAFDGLAAFRPWAPPHALRLDPASEQELRQPTAGPRRKAFEVLQGYGTENPPGRRVIFRFLRSPIEILGRNRVEAVRLAVNRLVGQPGALRAVPTGESEVIPCGLVIRCVGYRGRPIPGVPFDDVRGLVVNTAGRIEAGLYAAGWLRHGARGLIGTNKKESAATVAALLADADRLPRAPGHPGRLRAELARRGCQIISFADWQRIDAAEIERGRQVGKPREKFTRVREMQARVK